jgi:REP element-mobilizing transposase RayT
MFLVTLEEACKRAGFFLYSYVLMGNHYHLPLQTPEGNLVDGMKWLQSTYTARVNARHHQRGHLFQGRYKAIPIQGDETHYLRTLSFYDDTKQNRKNYRHQKNIFSGAFCTTLKVT